MAYSNKQNSKVELPERKRNSGKESGTADSAGRTRRKKQAENEGKAAMSSWDTVLSYKAKSL